MMQKEEIWQKLTSIFQKVFKNDSLTIVQTTKNEDIESWTSLNHAILLDSIEKEFNITFDFDDILTMQTVDEIFQKIDKLINDAH